MWYFHLLNIMEQDMKGYYTFSLILFDIYCINFNLKFHLVQ